MHFRLTRLTEGLSLLLGFVLPISTSMLILGHTGFYATSFQSISFLLYEPVLLLLFLALYWAEHKRGDSTPPLPWYIFLFFTLTTLGVLLSLFLFPGWSLAASLRIYVYGFLLLYLTISNKLPIKHLLYGLFWALLLQLSLGLYQVFSGSSLGIHFLGEPILEASRLGIAKVTLLSTPILRAYGTLPHPNILAAIALSSTALWYLVRHKIKSPILRLLPLVATVVIALTFSKSMIAMVIGLHLIFVLRHKLHSVQIAHTASALSVLVFIMTAITGLFVFFQFTTADFIVDRIDQYVGSIYYLFTHPFGAYLGLIQSGTVLPPWDIMPLHNTYLSIWQSFGVLPSLGFILLTVGPFMSHPKGNALYLLPFIPLLFIDHLWSSDPRAFLLLLLTYSIYVQLTIKN